jgi:hypothetical protein
MTVYYTEYIAYQIYYNQIYSKNISSGSSDPCLGFRGWTCDFSSPAELRHGIGCRKFASKSRLQGASEVGPTAANIAGAGKQNDPGCSCGGGRWSRTRSWRRRGRGWQRRGWSWNGRGRALPRKQEESSVTRRGWRRRGR